MVHACPYCQAQLRLPPEAAHRPIQCGGCGRVFHVAQATAIALQLAPARSEAVTATSPKPLPAAQAAAKPISRPFQLLALLPLGVSLIAISAQSLAGGLIGGAIWGGVGGAFAGLCLFVARRERWPAALRVAAMLGVAVLAYGLFFGVLGARQLFGWGWREFAPPGGRFHVMLPGKPSLQPAPPNLPARMTIYGLRIQRPPLEFAVVYGEVPPDEWKRVSLWQRFEDTRNGMLQNTPNANVVSQKRISLDGNPGREFHLVIPGQGEMIARYYFSNRRIFGLSVGGPNLKPDSEEARKFFDSFRIDPPAPEEAVKPEDQPPDWLDEDTIPNRKILDYLAEEGDAVPQIAFTPDGKKLVAFSQRRGLVVWDVDSHQIETTLRKSTDPHPPFAMNPVLRFAVSPDGKLAAAGVAQGPPALELYDLATGRKRADLVDEQMRPDQRWISNLAFSPDSRQLAVVNRDGLRVWNVAAAKVARRILRNDAGGGLAFMPDGSALITGGPNQIVFLDPFSGGEQRTLRLPPPRDNFGADVVTLLSVSAEGKRMATGGSRGSLRLWDVAAGKARTLQEQGQLLTTAELSPNGKLFVVGDQSGNVTIYDAAGKQRWHGQFFQIGLAAGMPVAAFSPDGRQLALAHPRRLEVWDVESLIQASADDLSPPAPVVAAAPAAEAARLVPGFQAHRAGGNVQWAHIQGLIASPDNATLITVSMDKTARAWSMATGEPLGEPLQLSGHPKTAASWPDGHGFVIAVQDAFNHKEELYLRDLKEADWKDPLAAFQGDGGPGARRLKNRGYLFAALAADGKTLAVATDRKCALLNWNDLSTRVDFPPSGFETHFLGVSPDGNTVAVAGQQDGHIHLFDARSGKEWQKLDSLQNGVRALAYSPNGKLLAASLANHRVALWDPRTCDPAPVLPGFSKGEAVTLAFSPDGAMLAVGGQDNGLGKVVLWDTANSKELTTFTYQSPFPWITCVAFTRDGNTLLGGAADGYVSLWPVAAFRHGK